MIKPKSSAEITTLREGGKRLAEILNKIAKVAKPGVKTGDLDKLARELIKQNGDEASFLNYQPAGAPAPYQFALCVSVNDEVVHGMPSERILQNGDIASLDLGLKHDGLFTDMALTVSVGEITREAQELLDTTKQALAQGILAARPGAHISDIGAAIEAVAKEHKYGLVRDLGGHGVGYKVHEEPMIANFGPGGEGPVIQPGWVLAIEPMLNLGGWRVKFLDDGYTVKTADHSLSAHFEQTIVVTEKGAEILTR